MGTDESGLTPREERVAAALGRALHATAAAEPLRLDLAGLSALRSRRSPWPGRLPAAVAVGLAAVVVAALALAAWPRFGMPGPAAAGPTLPGTPGHFDNGEFSFDYPAGWQVLAADYQEGMAVHVDAVLGTGAWKTGCVYTGNGGSCTGDTVDVSGGRVVVRIWRRVGGPVDACRGNNKATATFGPNAVYEGSYGSAVDWQIRLPGAEFGWAGNVDVAVWADGQAGRDQAEALVASFRWSAGAPNQAGNCLP